GFERKQIKDSMLLEAEIMSEIASRVAEVPKKVYSSSPLKESIGHTELEVIAGAFLGFFTGLAVSII
ncbi:divergent PAP2 family protein, partial [Mycobacterium tuberculosis]